MRRRRRRRRRWRGSAGAGERDDIACSRRNVDGTRRSVLTRARRALERRERLKRWPLRSLGALCPGGSSWAHGSGRACCASRSDGSGWTCRTGYACWSRRSGRPSRACRPHFALGTRRALRPGRPDFAPGQHAFSRLASRRIADHAQELLLAGGDRLLSCGARCQGCGPAGESERDHSHCNRAYVHASSLRRCRTGGRRGNRRAPDVPIRQECGKGAWFRRAVETSSLTRYREAREVGAGREFLGHASRAAQPRARPRRP